MTDEVKKVLGIALEAYPSETSAEMDEDQTAAMGDTLLLFVYREISQIDGEVNALDEAISRMEIAAKDIEAVLGALTQSKAKNQEKSP